MSIGYGCVYEITSGVYKGEHYDAIQRKIRGNHLASVMQGRMGPEVKVLDQHQLTFTIDAKDIQMPDTKEKPDDQKELSMDDVMSWVKENGPKMNKMQDMMNKHFGGDKAKDGDPDVDPAIAADKKAADEKEEKEKMEKDAADKAAKDAEEKEKAEKEGKDKAACDAAELRKQLVALDASVKDWQKNSFKKVMGEVKRRDVLAGKLSGFIGSFDHADMTLQETAEYGVEKLGLKGIDKGSEVAALDAYMHDRTPPSQQPGFSNDAKASDGVSEVSKFFSTAS